MEGLSKTLDTLIKAPLWFFLAAFLASGIPLLNFEHLTRLGATSDLKPLGFPLANLAILFFALFVSSSVARSYEPILKTGRGILDRNRWRRTIARLPEDAQALLAVAEEQGLDSFYFTPRAPAIVALRNSDILSVDAMAFDGEEWGAFRSTQRYKSAYGRYRAMFRSQLKYSHDEARDVRAMMLMARNRARATSFERA